jgi:hypothetical protein
VDVGLVYVDQQMPIALGAIQHARELLDESLSPLRIGPAQQLLGFLPRQLEAVQSSPDRLATAHQPEALADPADQAAQRPAWRWIRPDYGRRGGRALGCADRLAEFGFALWAKRGRRPPVRRNVSASGPWAL